MKRIVVIFAMLLALSVGSAVAAEDAAALSAPHWGGKGTKAAAFCTYSFFFAAFGWPEKTECETCAEGTCNYGYDTFQWWRYYPGAFISHGSQKFTNASQSIQCSELSSSGGFYKEPEALEGDGLEEFEFSGCGVWKGAFSSELKECHVSTLEGGLSTGKAGVVNFDTHAELVYLNTGGTKIGDLFAGSGKQLAKLDFTGTGCVKSNEQELGGEVLAEVEPINEEVQSVKMLFPASAKSACWKWVTNTVKACPTVKLTTYGEAATLSGNDTYDLTSKEAFGAFN
jgi:hypothetical protein